MCTTGWLSLPAIEPPGPVGSRQLAPGTYCHHCVIRPPLATLVGGMNTTDPGTSSSLGMSGCVAGSNPRSARVRYAVAVTNSRNCGHRGRDSESTDHHLDGEYGSGVPGLIGGYFFRLSKSSLMIFVAGTTTHDVVHNTSRSSLR